MGRLVPRKTLVVVLLPLFVLFSSRADGRDLGVVPQPRRTLWAEGSFRVDESTPILLGEGAGDGERFAANELADSLRRERNLTLLVANAQTNAGAGILLGNPAKDPRIAARMAAMNLSLTEPMKEEGYCLGVDGKGIVVAASSPAGLLYGAMTLRQMLLAGEAGRPLPAVRIHDWPAMKMRGVHDEISYGQVSTMENFKDILRFLAQYKLNTYMIYLEDMFRFSKYPSIGVGRGALTREQVDELEAFAKPYNVEIIPVFETLGNQGALLMLDEIRPFAEYPGAHSFSVSEETYRFLGDCLDELCAVFDSRYFNAGLDESWDLGFGKTREPVRRDGRGRVHAEHYKRIREMLASRGKTMMMYADIVLRRPEILTMIPKDIVMVDWHYEPEHHYPSVPLFAKAGFPLVTLPGMNNWDRIFPMMSGAMINIQNFSTDGYRAKALGSVISTWGDNGSKNLRELLYAGYAFTGDVTWAPEQADVGRFYNRFFTLWNGPGTAAELQAIYALLEKWPWWYPLLDYFRDPFLPRKGEKPHQEQDLYRVEEDARVAQELCGNLREKVIRRRGDLDYLDYCAAMHRSYVQQQRLVRDLSQYSPIGKSAEEQKAAQSEFAERAHRILREVERLRDVFKELWLRTNLPANLHYGVDDYDRVAKCWRDAIRRIESGVYAHDPRPPAKWIYAAVGFDPKSPAPDAYFRKVFEAPRDVLRANIEVQGDTHLIVYLNGKRLGEQFARRNLSAPVNPQLVQLYDLKPHLVEGPNVLAIEAHNYGTENENLDPGGPRFCGGFFLYGEIVPKEGETLRLLSDESWPASTAANAGWTEAGFEEKGWAPAAADPKPTVWVTYPDFEKNWPGYSSVR